MFGGLRPPKSPRLRHCLQNSASANGLQPSFPNSALASARLELGRHASLEQGAPGAAREVARVLERERRADLAPGALRGIEERRELALERGAAARERHVEPLVHG